MDSIEVFSLSKGKQMDSWKVGKGIVNMKLLQDGKSIVGSESIFEYGFFL